MGQKKWSCRKVRLNAGGYEYGRWGKYYGHGEPLFKVESEIGNESWMIRAANRKQAILNFCTFSYTLLWGMVKPHPEDFYGFKR